MSGLRYKAFLSYSHHDESWASWLHRALESYRPPRQLVGVQTPHGEVPRRLSPVFRDREELASATDLGEAINAALRESACQIVICSPQAARSRWVNEEILAFKRLGRDDRIFCLIVAGEPNASDDPARPDDECFPPALRFRLASDGSLSGIRAEPIAADARPGKDGRYAAKLKLIAGVLGVGYDALRRRDLQRRQRRMVAVTAGALAGMLLTSGLATFALVQRATALRQTARATAEAETAEQALGFLVDLFRIADPSEAHGNRVTAREMLDKGAAQLDRRLAAQPAIEARLMNAMGTAYMGLGLYRQARPLLDRSIAIRRAAPAGQPLVLAQALNDAGELLTRQAEFEGAEKSFREALALAPPPAGGSAERTARSRSLHGLGAALAQQGRSEEAERYLREALAEQRRLYAAPHNDVARTLQDLSKVVEQRGDLPQAIRLMQEAVEMHRVLHATEPDPAFAEAINDLGYLREQNGEHDAAEALFVEALDMKRRLLGPKHPEIAAGLANLALAWNNKGDLSRAEALYCESLEMQRDLLGPIHPDVADTLNLLAFVQYDRGETAAALHTELEAMQIYRRLFPGDHPEVARIENRIGLWRTLIGAFPDARRDLDEALAMRRRLLGATHPDVASSLTHLAILDVATGRYAAALASARDARAIFEAASGADWKAAIAESAEGGALVGLGRLDEAEPHLLHSIGVLARKDIGAPLLYQRIAAGYLDRLRTRQARATSRVAAAGEPADAGSR